MKVDILGVKVDRVNMAQAVETVLEWVSAPRTKNHQQRTKYIVTPNVEFTMLAQKDPQFRKILNQANLAIPDSARFGWANSQLQEKNIILKLIKWPLFLLPQLFPFDTVTGTDLMGELIKLAAKQGFTIGFLGGRDLVAEKLAERLTRKYPKLKVTFAESGGEIDEDGNLFVARGPASSQPHPTSSLASKHAAGARWGSSSSLSGLRAGGPLTVTPRNNSEPLIPPTDILFVAFGHLKQEKWIANNLDKQPVRVMMGVGGAFDYLSGAVPRAPVWLRSLGLEWLFRISLQPWRIKRFSALVKFVFLVLLSK